MTRQELIKLTSHQDVVHVEMYINLGMLGRWELRKVKSPVSTLLEKSWSTIVEALSGLSDNDFDDTIKSLCLDELARENIEAFLDDCHN